MSNIYVVMSGEYSDKTVEGVFDNEELAKTFAKRWPYDGRVYTYELNPDNPFIDKINNGLKCFAVYLYNGEVDNSWECDMSDSVNEESYNPESGGIIWAISGDEAKKIAADKWAKWKYESEVMPTASD